MNESDIMSRYAQKAAQEIVDDAISIVGGRSTYNHSETATMILKHGGAGIIGRHFQEMIQAIDRAANGCRVCYRLPNAAGMGAHDVVGLICDPCLSRLDAHYARESSSDEVMRRTQISFDSNRRCALYVMHRPQASTCKVGYSIDPEKRRRTVEREIGDRLVLAHTSWFETVDAARSAEKRAHLILWNMSVPGEREWFTVECHAAIHAVEQVAA